MLRDLRLKLVSKHVLSSVQWLFKPTIPTETFIKILLFRKHHKIFRNYTRLRYVFHHSARNPNLSLSTPKMGKNMHLLESNPRSLLPSPNTSVLQLTVIEPPNNKPAKWHVCLRKTENQMCLGSPST